MTKRHLAGRILVGLALFFLGPGCRKQETSFEAKLVSAITTKCQNRFPCTIRIKDVSNFEWDKLYVFKYTAHRGVVEKTIGSPLKDYKEFHRRIIFTDNGRIVFHEEEPTDIEHVMNNEVVFDIPDSSDYRVYDAETVFTVEKVSASEGSYYQLRKAH